MAYLMDEISEAATKRRLEEITSSGLRALQECAERSAEIDKEAQETEARQEAERKAMEKERDELAAAQRVDQQPSDQQPAGQPWPSWKPKPSVLSIDAEELAEEATVSASAPTPPIGFAEPAAVVPPPPPEPEPVPPARPAKDHVLLFGAEEPDEEPPPQPPAEPRPSPTPRPARADREDDDWSDTNWIR